MFNESSLDGNLSTPVEDNPWSNLNVPYTIAEFLVAIAAVVGNLLVIVVYLKERKLRKRTKYYIISLAIADLLVGFFGIPFAILASIGLPRNIYLCLFNMSLLIVLCTISIYCLVAVSVDRYWAILYPMSYSRNVRSRTAIEIIIICWLTGALVGFLPLFGWNEGGRSDRKCFFVEVMNYNYLVFLYFSTIIAPAMLLAAFYAHIYRVVIQQMRQMVLVSPDSSSSTNSSDGMLKVLGAARNKEVKATQNLSIIVLFFIICWFPLYTINFIKAVCRDCNVSPTLTNSCIILSHLNSSCNPLLYAYHLKDFRVALHNLIFRSKDLSRGPKSSFNQRYRPQSEIKAYCTTMVPSNSIKYLLNAKIVKNSKDKPNGNPKSNVWTISGNECILKKTSPESNKAVIHPIPSSQSKTLAVEASLSIPKISKSHSTKLVPRFRSRCLSYPMTTEDSSELNEEFKENEDSSQTKIKPLLLRTFWSWEDLKTAGMHINVKTTEL